MYNIQSFTSIGSILLFLRDLSDCHEHFQKMKIFYFMINDYNSQTRSVQYLIFKNEIFLRESAFVVFLI